MQSGASLDELMAMLIVWNDTRSSTAWTRRREKAVTNTDGTKSEVAVMVFAFCDEF